MLGLAYLERSEPVASIMLAAPLVLWVTYVRTPGDRKSRYWAGLTDATILAAPIATCFVAWAVISYVIQGQPFEQFTSKYGNSALIASSHISTGTLSDRIVHEIHAVGYLAPALPIILVAALVSAAFRRNAQAWVIVAILGGGLGFSLLSYLANSIFPWYRYYVLVTPIAVLLVASMFAAPTRIRRVGDPATTGAHLRLLAQGPYAHIGPAQRTHLAIGRTASGAAIAVLIILALLTPSIPGSIKGMDNLSIAPDVYLYYGYIFHRHPTAEDKKAAQAFPAVEKIANYVDALHLPNGDVVVDSGDNCIPGVQTNVHNPRVFVITNDRDFQRILDDPLTFHAHYLLASVGSSNDSVAQQYPNLGEGTQWATLVHTFPARGFCNQFDLYRVTGHPQGTF
jgi:hypothetical protein